MDAYPDRNGMFTLLGLFSNMEPLNFEMHFLPMLALNHHYCLIESIYAQFPHEWKKGHIFLAGTSCIDQLAHKIPINKFSLEREESQKQKSIS